MRPWSPRSVVQVVTCALALLAPAASGQDEARRIEVVFEGQAMLSAGALRRALVDPLLDIDARGARAADVDDAAYELELVYLDAGHAFVDVGWVIEDRADGVREVRFLIDEGPRVLVEAIHFDGNQAFGDETLARLYEAPATGLLGGGEKLFIRGRMNDLAGDAESLYRGIGFDEVRVTGPQVTFDEERVRATARFEVIEGPVFEVREITFSGNEQVTDEEIEAAVAPLVGERLRRRLVFELRTRVEGLLSDDGFPDRQVEVEEVSRDPAGQVSLHVSLVEGQRVTVGRVRVEGQVDTREAFIRERIPFAAGDVWSGSLQRQVSRGLLATGLFRSVSAGLVGDGPERDFLVEVEDAKSLELYVKPGYGAYERARLSVGVRENNLFGTGRSGNLEAGVSTRSEFVELTLSDPWVLDKQRVVTVPVSYRRRDEPSFTSRTRRVEAHVRQRWSQDLSTMLGSRYEVSTVSDVDPDVEEDLREDSKVTSLFAQVRHDTRDRVFNPTRGQVRTAYAEVAVPAFGADLEFIRLEGSLAHFWPLTERVVLAASARSGFIVPTGDTSEIPLPYRYFNGGQDSVRSFKYSDLGPKDDKGQPLGGETVNTLNLEARYNWSETWQSAVFFDYGNVGLTTGDYFDDFREGLGVGQRYLLPVGSVRLDVGFNPSARDGEDDWVVGLAIGMAF